MVTSELRIGRRSTVGLSASWLYMRPLTPKVRRYDLLQFAIYRIVAFFVDNKNAIKVNNLIVARW